MAREEDQEIKIVIVPRASSFAAQKGTKSLILSIGRGEDFVLKEFPPGTHNREIQRHLGLLLDGLALLVAEGKLLNNVPPTPKLDSKSTTESTD